MTYGVTTEGFVRKTNEEIVSDLETEWKTEFGQDSDLSEDSPNSILIGLIAAMSDSLWQTAEDTYNSLNRNTASGVPLENAVSLVGIDKKAASASTSNVSFKGDNATSIPSNTQVKQSSTGLIFETLEDNFITQGECNWIQITVTTISNNATYRFYIDGNAYSYVSDGTATADEIVAGLKAVVEAAAIGLTITDEGSGLMTIEATDKDDIYDITADSKMTVGKVQSQIEVTALEVGQNGVAAETIDTISTAISGLDSVINYYEGEAGREIETDQELRLRTQQDIAVAGFNFVDAIRAKVLDEVSGVSYCRVYENDSLTTDANNIPAKSFEAVVEGGSNANIADQLFQMKVAGIKSYGDVTVEVKDDQDIPHNIQFSRPSNLYMWVKVVIDSYNDEEDFPDDGEAAIKESILEFGEDYLNIGDVVVTQKFYTPLYEIDGIASATITIASTSTAEGTPTYSSSNINCSIKEKPLFDLSRIEVTL
jgi:uncharacterized phage protein gp47/JayE